MPQKSKNDCSCAQNLAQHHESRKAWVEDAKDGDNKAPHAPSPALTPNMINIVVDLEEQDIPDLKDVSDDEDNEEDEGEEITELLVLKHFTETLQKAQEAAIHAE
ncbi:hypothetical protein C0991_001879 [Blastosporella zonata]|nr:hypothetical protein C0991_001879 [Blastosporella zonata]